MIIFDLVCDCGYQFEGWFQNHDDYSSQQESGLLECPVCGKSAVRKILSPVAVHSNTFVKVNPPSENQQEDVKKEIKAASEAIKTLQEFVKKNFENVGDKFADESLKIHYGVEEPRNIRGVTTEEEEKILKDEGIDLLKLPMPVCDDDAN